MAEQILSLVFGLIIPFGPAAYVLVRWNASPGKITPDMIRVVVLWTAFMLLIKVNQLGDMRSDLKYVCNQLEARLAQQYGDATTAREEVGSECHPEDYEPPERNR